MLWEMLQAFVVLLARWVDSGVFSCTGNISTCNCILCILLPSALHRLKNAVSSLPEVLENEVEKSAKAGCIRERCWSLGGRGFLRSTCETSVGFPWH